MKTRLFKVFNLTAILTLIFNSFAFGQTQQVTKAEEEINKVMREVGVHFNQALLYYAENRRTNARDEFDKSVEVFLLTSVDTQRKSNERLKICYDKVLETIYLIEFPSNSQPPQIRNVAESCGWTINKETADKVLEIALKTPTKTDGNSANTLVANQDVRKIGFDEQVFEASPLDELAKLELTPEETNIDTPQSQEQIQYIQYAVSNKSLGFNFQVHPMIQQFVNYYQGRGKATMETGLYRSGMFMRMARRIFREEGVPENVAWLGQVESAWKPAAMSWASASGLWQFIPGTGSRYGLRRTPHLDERNSFEKATRASAQYLKFLANRYGGNWELAMGAYNCGEGNVDKAIRRAGVANFWQAYQYLPKETRNYVPNILATILIANNPNQYGFGHVRPAPQLLYDQIRVPASTNLSILAQASDTTVEYLRYLNPELRTNMSPPEPYIVRIPQGKSNDVVALFRKMPKANVNLASITNTTAGENWQNIANRTGVTVEQLQAANGNAPKPKGKVVVPNGNNVRNTSYTRPTAPPALPQTSGVRVVKAKAGDTVAKLAAREGASAIEIAKFNGLLPNSVLPAGREIKIPGR